MNWQYLRKGKFQVAKDDNQRSIKKGLHYLFSCYRPPTMAERLSNDLLRIWQSGEFSDVTLVCSDGGKVEAHKQILASRSHYFARMMFGKMKEGGEREVVLQAKEKPLRLLLTHLYSNQVALEEEQVVHLAELLDLARMIVDPVLEKRSRSSSSKGFATTRRWWKFSTSRWRDGLPSLPGSQSGWSVVT